VRFLNHIDFEEHEGEDGKSPGEIDRGKGAFVFFMPDEKPGSGQEESEGPVTEKDLREGRNDVMLEIIQDP
jgi:hypothetical protein